mmetsp:Transcript_2288/g.4425  ORF Transcript_2288/g.4425 Transcript_2288/m.4425 type:complete len:558 (-) Transcript_2288:2825-4498(-)
MGKSRVIIHMDLDCFYCQVEARRLNIPPEVPLACQQWFGLIATNYPARAAGVTRFTNIAKAKEICPGIRFVHVELIGKDGQPVDSSRKTAKQDAKVSLRRYRQASFQVMDAIRSVVPLKYIERASVDEVYIDASNLVEEDSQAEREILEKTNVLGDVENLENQDTRLVRGCVLLYAIRQAVREKTGFTMSGGVAENKILAKIASAHNKPDKQTLVPKWYSTRFIRSISISKIPGFGGKYGDKIKTIYKEKTGTQVEKFTLDDLIANVGWDVLKSCMSFSSFSNLQNVAAGIDMSVVEAKMAPKSLLSAKRFTDTSSTKLFRSWLHVLCRELFERAHADAIMFARVPCKLALSFSESGKSASRIISMPNPNPFVQYVQLKQKETSQELEEEIKQMEKNGSNTIVRLCLETMSSVKSCSFIGLTLDGFQPAKIPGSWADDKSQHSKQQQKFADFFAPSSKMKCDSLYEAKPVVHAKRKRTVLDMFQRAKTIKPESDSTRDVMSKPRPIDGPMVPVIESQKHDIIDLCDEDEEEEHEGPIKDAFQLMKTAAAGKRKRKFY